MSSVIQIRPARREGARLVIMLAGVSGSGKTRTALEIAYGLADHDPSKIGFLDTENRRGSLFADVYQRDREHPSSEPFLIGDLYAPFSPARYVEAIHAFQQAGVEVLIIDSGTHEWEGIGGCHDIAEAGNPKVPKWNKAKAEHKRFMNAMLSCDMHVILCLRARHKAKPEKQLVNGQEKTVFVDLGLQAITEQNVLFEATASLYVHDSGTRQTIEKCPPALLPFLGRGEGYITDKDGIGIRQWVAGAVQLDPKVENWRNRLISITERGQAYVDECWAQVPPAIAKALGADFLGMLKASASEYDRQARESKDGDGDDGGAGELNDALGSAAAAAGAEPIPPAPIEDPEPEAEPEPPAKDPEPPAPANDNTPPARPARSRRAGSNPKPPAEEKPAPPPSPPADKASKSTDLF